MEKNMHMQVFHKTNKENTSVEKIKLWNYTPLFKCIRIDLTIL